MYLPNAEKVASAKQLLESFIDEDSEIVTIYKVEDATDERSSRISWIWEKIESRSRSACCENQPVYPYLLCRIR